MKRLHLFQDTGTDEKEGKKVPLTMLLNLWLIVDLKVKTVLYFTIYCNAAGWKDGNVLCSKTSACISVNQHKNENTIVSAYLQSYIAQDNLV